MCLLLIDLHFVYTQGQDLDSTEQYEAKKKEFKKKGRK